MHTILADGRGDLVWGEAWDIIVKRLDLLQQRLHSY